MDHLPLQTQFSNFRDRIISTLNLKQSSSNLTQKQKQLTKLLKNELDKLKKNQQLSKKASNPYFFGMFKKIINSDQKQQQTIKISIRQYQNDLKNLINCLKNRFIPTTLTFTSQDISKDILSLVSDLKQKRLQSHFALVKGPFINNLHIYKKQHLNQVLQKNIINDLKFIIIQQKVAHIYQRNLVQEIFGRIFRHSGTLSMVIKIQINNGQFQQPSTMFCYIQNKKKIDQNQIIKPLTSLIKKGNTLQIQHQGQFLQINQLNFLTIILSEILVIPTQSLISDFIVRIANSKTSKTCQQQATIVKCNLLDQQQIVKQSNLKDHPSLRNPLLFFSQYLRTHTIKIASIKKLSFTRDLYSSFYRSLQLIIQLLLTDFSTTTQQTKINSSICFNIFVFKAIWTIFHKISLLTNWITEVIQPIKPTISITQLLQHFCPILNQISNRNIQTFPQYLQFYKNVQMGIYLSSIITKKSLNKYLDLFINNSQAAKNLQFTNTQQIFNEIFKPIIYQTNLKYLQPIQSIYIFYFVQKYLYQYKPPSQLNIQKCWKQHEIWEKCIKKLNEQSASDAGPLPFVDISFDILGYSCGINIYQLDSNCFQRIKNFQQTTNYLQGIALFIDFLRKAHPKQSQQILSSILQKSYKYKKSKLCKLFLLKNVHLLNFTPLVKMQKQIQQNLIQNISKYSSQMYRLFKWQYQIQIILKQYKQKIIKIQTIDYNQLYLPQQVLNTHVYNGQIINNLQKNNYKFDYDRNIALINYKTNNGYPVSYYLEYSEFPTIPYFYRSFLTRLGIPEIIPYFTSFYYQGKLLHLVQSFDQSLNFKKGILKYKQHQLLAMTNQSLISQSIILSMMLLPSKIQTQDLIINPSKATNDQIFIIDLHHHFCQNYMNKYLGKIILNSKNCLFLLDLMTKPIDSKILFKYSIIQIDNIIQHVLDDCKNINNKICLLKQKYCKQNCFQSNNQLTTIIFQKKFIFNLVQRMYKIKRIFIKQLSNQSKILTYFGLLELINKQISYLYSEFFYSANNILLRQKILFDQNYKQPFLQINFSQFFGNFDRLKQIHYLFPYHYERFCFQGPTENLVDFSTNMKKLQAFNDSSLPQNLQHFSNDNFQYFMKNCDMSKKQPSQRQKLGQLIKLKSKQHINSQSKRGMPLSYICLKYLEFVKDKTIANCFSFQRVQQLQLQYCKLGQYQFNSLPKQIQNIQYLTLWNVSGMKYIGQNPLYSKSIQIRHLKNLSIRQCNDLIGIDMKCEILQTIQLRTNLSLQNCYIYSLNLKHFYIYNNPSINFQNIALHILKGINILICKLSSHGDFFKLFTNNYQIYLINILQCLFVRFNSLQNRYTILLTLLKIKQIDQSLLFLLAGIPNLRTITSIFNKFTRQSQDKILTSVLKLYFSNPFNKKISLSQLVPNINTTQLYLQRILKLTNISLQNISNKLQHITQLHLETSKQFFSQTNTNNLKSIINLLKFDKNLTIIIHPSKQPPQQPQNQQLASTIQRQISIIRSLSIQKPQLQKITLIYKNKPISSIYFDTIFKNILSLQDMKKQNQPIKSDTTNINIFRSTFRQTMKQQKLNYIKIVNLTLEKCTLANNLLNKKKQIKSQNQSSKFIDITKVSKINQSQRKQPQQKSLQFHSIIKNNCIYSSIKYLKLQNCNILSIQLFQSLPNLTSLAINNCKYKNLGYKQLKKQQDFSILKKLFLQLSKLQLHTLDLSSFFTTSKLNPLQLKLFQQFCLLLIQLSQLKILKLNHNIFLIDNLIKIDNVLNQTHIEQLSLTSLTFSEMEKNDQLFVKLFQNTKYLKSLAIQLNSINIFKFFIEAISKNTSLVQLKIFTNCQIQPSLFNPLLKNTSLSVINSNIQLPFYLLNHLTKAQQKYPKQKQKKQQNSLDKALLPDLHLTLGNISTIKSNDYYRLGLSLDGGGVRGMLLAAQLHYLVTQVGYPLHKIFDCIGGTSIGGILALVSTGSLDGQNPVANTQQLMQIFSKYGKDIFKKTQYTQIKNLFDTKYSSNSFQNVLKNYFKDCKLSDCLPQTNVIVTAVNRIDNKDYIFRSNQSIFNRDLDFYMRDAARATSAAPTYFPSAQIKNINASIKLSLIDGGVGMNNPSKLVIDQVKKMSVNDGAPSNYFLLSLGTGKLPNQSIPQYAGLKDLSPIIDSFTQSAANFVQRDLTNNYKGHFIRVSPLINVKDRKDAQLDNTNPTTIQLYKQCGQQAAKDHFKNNIIFGKYRNMNLIQWLKYNTEQKYED